ncbi:tyrosine-type recombinase/integrase [Methylobacterium sp. WL64]|uniref:tyrosine-type recombinase/integrase n=1 Tax=Methylobacterium sp. WL64 TaxID=2603894 RepID=UPI001FEE1838|nr:tyrosine-type recombinase/integrase [Methylobacterium sp. WL64]
MIDGNRVEQRLAQADDLGSDPDALSYPSAVTAAIDWARAQVRRLDGEGEGDDAEVPSVRTAVEAYVAARSKRAPTAGRDAEKRLGKHVLSDQAFADMHLAKLNAGTVQAWRRRLSSELQPTTVNRLLNDLRAALNAAAEHHRRMLPATLAAEIRAGTKANSAGSTARKQVLPDAEIRRLVDAAFAIDETGDFGRLVLVMAATGARHSQVARITVGDVQVARGRIMVPPSNKGRAGKRPTPIAVPVGADVIERLQVALAGRRGHEPLLLHWRHRQVGPVTWERIDRGPWATASTALRLWNRARTRAEAPPGTVMLCLRHSSIVRALSVGVPVRLVAALHDTSVQMIEDHYSAYIVEETEEIARRAVTPLAPSAVATLKPVDGAAA